MLTNPGKIDLELLEIQSGDYLAEDDIIRLKDYYEGSLVRSLMMI